VVLSTSTWGDTGPSGRYLDYTLELVSLSAAPAHNVPPDYRLTLALTSD
jgi:hypothetical protein